MAEMKNKFSVRGYKPTQINGAVDQIMARPRPDLFQRKINNEKSPIVFSTKYSKQSEKIGGIIKNIGTFSNLTLTLNKSVHKTLLWSISGVPI